MACPSLSLKLEREAITMVIGNAIIVGGSGSISPSDEGKVVSNGTLVSQGSQTITQNGTYDTTLISELIANISGGGEKNILSGTDMPTASVGSDGDIYIKYDDYRPIMNDYTVIEYLGVESAGAYIDTGVANTSDAYFEIDCNWTSAPSNNSGIFGAQTNYEYTVNAWQGVAFISAGTHANISTPLIRHKLKADASHIYIDDVATSTQPNWSNVTGRNYYILANNYNNGLLPASNARVYSVKIWNGDNLVRNFIPVKRNSDDVLGMYDFVNDVFYTNSGTGSFVGGDEMTNTPIDTAYLKVNGSWIILEDGDLDDVNTGGDTPQPVDDWTTLTDYIESSGTQYIDTGYSVQSDTRIEVVANVPDNIERYPAIFGARTKVADECVIFAEFNSGNIAMVWANGDEPFVPTFWGRGYINKKCNYVLGGGGEISIKDVDGNGFVGNRTVGTPASIPLYLFVLNEGGSPISITFCSMKLYRFRIYEDDTLVHEFIPWTDSNDVVCLKDTVTGNFKYNAGTGNFIYGTDS